MKQYLVISFLLVTQTFFSQEYLNLNFESVIEGTDSPVGWYIGQPPYSASIDTVIRYRYSKSLRFEADTTDENSFGMSSMSFPVDAARGKILLFKGKVKTEKVENGYAGLWLSASNEEGTLAFENMNDRGLLGTNDWRQVSIEIPIDETVSRINFGGIFTGKGIVWFDDFEIFIDDKKYEDVKPKPRIPSEEELYWLERQVMPLSGFEPDMGSEDLEILDEIIGDAQMVGLGETSHGSSEIFKMKHRIVKYLAERKDFDVFSIEANMPESYRLNDYIVNGQGNPVDLIKGIYFWTWRTQEVLDMVQWMHRYNQTEKNIRFTGFDMQFFEGPVSELKKAFENDSRVLSSINLLETQLADLQMEGAPQDSQDKASVLIADLKAELERSQFLGEKAWVCQNLRLLDQYVTGGNARDRFLAENVLWIRSQASNSKLVLWGHNGHIQETGDRMGAFLADSLGNDYVSIGFTFGKGTYTAVGEEGLSNYLSQKAPAGSYESFFEKIDEPIFLLDLRKIKKENSPMAEWILEELTIRNVGALKTENEFYKSNLTEDFDVIIFIQESTSSTILE